MSRKLYKDNYQKYQHKNTNAERKIQKNHEALKAKNKELAAALDETRKDVSHLFQENLFLKKERQQLLERVASLEGRLSQLITLHATEQSLSEMLQEIESKVTQARSLLCTRSGNEKTSNELKLTFRSSLSPIVNCNIPITTKISSTPVRNEIEQQMEVDQVEQDGQHLIHTSACDREDKILDTEVTHQEMDTLSELGLSVLGRPKRACTSMIQSYQEPCLQSKLRRGDRFTNSFNFLSPSNDKKKKTKKRIRQNPKPGLQDVTNKMEVVH